MRYRKPSLKTALGITKAKKRIKKNLGIYEVTKYTNASKNVNGKVKRKSGYYTEPMKFLRFLIKLFK
ncbi:hypothetical protein [Kiloniella laminariae]|uniref:hypothetical protein n=1 Tax=Kiloniella laminariae TaxID=454162 RepID=UPI00035D7062|nr:hypothetical protein [Kiloniella laminariae]